MRGANLIFWVVGCAATLIGCDLSGPGGFAKGRVAGGDPRQGLAILETGIHGCGACHTIPGLGPPHGVAGPPLAGMARRGFIAGQLPNTPGLMVAFLQNPPTLVPTTGMPDTGLDVGEARHIAAYLYTLEEPDAR